MAKRSNSGIVWLASYPRSGNTWTRNFLNNLFAVLEGAGETPKDINTLSEYTIWDIPAGRFAAVIGRPLWAASHEEVAAARAERSRFGVRRGEHRARQRAVIARARPEPEPSVVAGELRSPTRHPGLDRRRLS